MPRLGKVRFWEAQFRPADHRGMRGIHGQRFGEIEAAWSEYCQQLAESLTAMPRDHAAPLLENRRSWYVPEGVESPRLETCRCSGAERLLREMAASGANNTQRISRRSCLYQFQVRSRNRLPARPR